MSGNAAIIDSLIEQHHTLRQHAKLVGEAIADIEAALTLRLTRREWAHGSPETISEKQQQLQQTMGFLDEGLKKHFAFEEKVLPPLLGELLMRALTIEHRVIKGRIDQAKSVLYDIKLEGSSQDELLAKKSRIQQTIDDIIELIEEHATNEETILKMLKKALQAK